MSITSRPMLPLSIGSSITGLPSENGRVALTLDGVMMVVPRLALSRTLRACARPHLRQDLVHGGAVELAGRLTARQQKVEQVVVRQVHQRSQPFGLTRRDA